MIKGTPERLTEPKPTQPEAPKPPAPPREPTEKELLRKEHSVFSAMLGRIEPGKAREILRVATASAMSDPMTREQVRRRR